MRSAKFWTVDERIRKHVWRLLAFGMLAAVAQGQTTPDAGQPAKHAFGAKDWSTLRSARAQAISADGKILYAIEHGGEKGPTTTEWWTVAGDGSQPAKLELPQDFSPIGFTQDGRGLYGEWKVNDQKQLAIFAMNGSKTAAVPATVVLLPRGMESATASPDGRYFAIVADPRDPDKLESVRHVVEPEESSLYVVKTNGTEGGWWCAGLKSISGDMAWNADGSSLAVLSQVPRIGHHEVQTALDVCNLAGAQHVTDVAGVASGIAWADGGKQIAFLSTKSEVLTPEHVWTVSASGGTAEDRTPALAGTAMELKGDATGRVWVVVAHGVRTDLEDFLGNTLKPAYEWPRGTIEGLPVTSEYVSSHGQVAVTVDDPDHATNVAVPQGGQLRRITHEGDESLSQIDLGPVRVEQWKSKDGVALEGIATFPAGYKMGTKCPFLVLPHGGPEANDVLEFDPWSRIIAGLGYVVLQPQYRGSTGYGADFLADIYQHFGDRAYEDVDSATDYAVAQGWADPNRLSIFGWSAGGFMTAWTVTQTNRYKAAIEGAGITDWGPFLWTSDIAQVDYDARWTDEAPEAFRKFSPVAFAHNVTTPLLILHGEADKRVPTFQGLEFFQLLAARDKTVRLVTYPGSPHFPTLWEQRLNVMEELTNWLKQYNKP
jgi:dipeptidyl aminopeptidase/acylaminoacyl peptidase